MIGHDRPAMIGQVLSVMIGQVLSVQVLFGTVWSGTVWYCLVMIGIDCLVMFGHVRTSHVLTGSD